MAVDPHQGRLIRGNRERHCIYGGEAHPDADMYPGASGQFDPGSHRRL